MTSRTLQSWKPSKIAKDRIAKRRSTYVYKMDATCLAAVYIAILFLLMPWTPHTSYGRYPRRPVDLAVVKHAVPMPGALREDALIVSVTRDGGVYFGNLRVQLADLPEQVLKSMNKDVERKIYLVADARAKYGDVKAVLEILKKTGIENVALIVDSR